MRHLSVEEFVDAVEGVLPERRAAHVEGCAHCREHVAAARAALVSLRDADMPEPSPLYWQHLSARIHDSVANDRIDSGWRVALAGLFGGRDLVPAVSSALLIVVVLAGGVLMRGRGTTVLAPAPSVATTGSDVSVANGIEDSEVWQVLTSAASDMPLDDAHAAGMAVQAGAIDGAVQRMSPDELNELGRLLQSELRGSGD